MNILPFRSKLHLLPDQLSTNGFFIVDDVFENNIFISLVDYFDNLLTEFRSASIGHKSSKLVDKSSRSDSILWIEEQAKGLESYFLMIQEVINSLKQDLYLPIRRTETQMALYRPGNFYLRHQDRHKDSSHRWVTAVFYLNQSWSNQDAGELIIYTKSMNTVGEQKIQPIANRLVLFLSELEHEVKVTTQVRKSFTTWFRDDV